MYNRQFAFALFAITGLQLLQGCSCNTDNPTTQPDPRVVDAGSDSGPGDPPIDPGINDPTCEWEAWNDGLVGGAISDVTYNPHELNTVYVIAGTRFYRKTPTTSWTLQSTPDFSFRHLGFAEDEPETIYAATTDGIVRSTDQGKTWSIYSLNGFSIGRLLIHPDDPRRFFASAKGIGIFRSNDRGMKWSLVSQTLPVADYSELVGDPEDSDVVYASLIELDSNLSRISKGRVVKSTDGGDTWTDILTDQEEAFDVTLCTNDTNKVWVASELGYSYSTDGGSNWTHSTGIGTGVTEIYLADNDCDTAFAITFGVGVYRTTDAGQNWSGPLDSGLNLVSLKSPGHIALRPNTDNTLFAATHAGLFETIDAADTWNGVQDVGTLDIRRITKSPLNSELLMGTWGSSVWTKNKNDWTRVDPEDLPEDYIFTLESSPFAVGATLIGAWPKIYSHDGSDNYSHVASSNTFNFAYHPTDAQTILAATQNGVFKSIDGGDTWAFKHTGIDPWATSVGTRRDIRAVLIDSDDPTIMYAGTNGRGIYRSSDSGESWTQLSYASLSVIPCFLEHEEGISACILGMGLAHSVDNGDNWTDISEGLTTLDISTLYFDERESRLYAGSGEGLFSKTDETPFERVGLNCVPGESLQHPVTIDENGKQWVVAATSGDGVYRHPAP